MRSKNNFEFSISKEPKLELGVCELTEKKLLFSIQTWTDFEMWKGEP